jgi:hypothetical protein
VLEKSGRVVVDSSSPTYCRLGRSKRGGYLMLQALNIIIAYGIWRIGYEDVPLLVWLDVECQEPLLAVFQRLTFR